MQVAASLAGASVVITGAGAGLGRATTVAVARAGARVFAVSNEQIQLDDLAKDSAAAGLKVETRQADVSEPERCKELITEIETTAGRIDIMINNAGIIMLKTVEETSFSDWQRTMAVNLTGPYLYSQAVLPGMKRERHGLIVNVSSRAGAFGFPLESAYCASKFGLEGFTRSLALEVIDSGIVAVTVHPGFPMRTPMSYTTYDARSRRVWKEPEELAAGLMVLLEAPSVDMTGGRFDLWDLACGGLPADLGPNTAMLRAPRPIWLTDEE